MTSPTKWRFNNKHKTALSAISKSQQRLVELRASTPTPLHSALDALDNTLQRQAASLSSPNYVAAFFGHPAAGKTLIIASAAGLMVEGKRPKDRSALLASGGRSTPCPTTVLPHETYAIHIKPASHLELDIALEGVVADALNDGEGLAPPNEITRCLWGLTGVTDFNAFCAGKTKSEAKRQLLEQIGMASRIECDLFPTTDSEPLVWLKEQFKKVAEGRHPKVPLPDEIIVEMPAGATQTQYQYVYLDTRGFDVSGRDAVRPDVVKAENDPRSVIVIVEQWGPAGTSPVHHDLVKRLKQTDSLHRLLWLVNARADDMVSMRDRDGQDIDDPVKGCEVKREQVQNLLRRLGITDDVSIICINAAEDPPTILAKAMDAKVTQIRDLVAADAAKTGAAVQNFPLAVSKLQEVLRDVVAILARSGHISFEMSEAFDTAVHRVRLAHPRKVWAMARRQGEYLELPLLHALDGCGQSPHGAAHELSARRPQDPIRCEAG